VSGCFLRSSRCCGVHLCCGTGVQLHGCVPVWRNSRRCVCVCVCVACGSSAVKQAQVQSRTGTGSFSAGCERRFVQAVSRQVVRADAATGDGGASRRVTGVSVCRHHVRGSAMGMAWTWYVRHPRLVRRAWCAHISEFEVASMSRDVQRCSGVLCWCLTLATRHSSTFRSRDASCD
jgi:hypothetical protein